MLREKIEANERIRQTQVELGLRGEERLPFLCECDDVSCRALVRLTVSEYAEVRGGMDRYVVIEGHAHDGRVVSTGQGYFVAES